MINKFFTTVLFLAVSSGLFAGTYQNVIRDPNNSTKSLFQIKTSDGATQFMKEIQFPLTCGYIGSTTTAFIGVVTSSTAPGLESTASDSMFLDWADGETSFFVGSIRVPIDYNSGGRIIFEAKSEQNVATATNVIVYGSVNGGSHVSESTSLTSAIFADINVDIVTGNLTLTAGDDFTFIITRDDTAVTTGSGTLNIKNIIFRYNDSMTLDR